MLTFLVIHRAWCQFLLNHFCPFCPVSLVLTEDDGPTSDHNAKRSTYLTINSFLIYVRCFKTKKNFQTENGAPLLSTRSFRASLGTLFFILHYFVSKFSEHFTPSQLFSHRSSHTQNAFVICNLTIIAALSEEGTQLIGESAMHSRVVWVVQWQAPVCFTS